MAPFLRSPYAIRQSAKCEILRLMPALDSDPFYAAWLGPFPPRGCMRGVATGDCNTSLDNCAGNYTPRKHIID